MDLVPNDLLVFLVRWTHVIAGIMWIGNSFYFMWLDANMADPDHPDPKVEGALWMVHSGGFYQVQKRLIGPGSMPKILHWFKWEATVTWLTGFFLLTLVFYMRGAVMLIDPQVLDVSPPIAVALSLAILAGSWVVYDLLWTSPVANSRGLAYAISLFLTLCLIVGGTWVFSGRGAFIHLGAVFGTLMVLNVWVRILPAQRAMIAATERGVTPDYGLGKKAKQRSTHNSYMTLPVLFAMLGGHLPAASAHRYVWAVILLFVLMGMALRHVMILHTYGRSVKLWLVPNAVLLAALVGLLHFQPGVMGQAPGAGQAEVNEQEAFAIVQRRCVSCHAADPVDASFGPLPGGISLERRESLRQYADKIHLMAVATKAMPLVNKTNMTDEERAQLGAWLKTVTDP